MPRLPGAIIDSGFLGLAARQASGDLPSTVITRDFCGGRLVQARDAAVKTVTITATKK